MGTRCTGARVEQFHRVEMDTIPQIHLAKTLHQCIPYPLVNDLPWVEGEIHDVVV